MNGSDLSLSPFLTSLPSPALSPISTASQSQIERIVPSLDLSESGEVADNEEDDEEEQEIDFVGESVHQEGVPRCEVRLDAK
jgi:hypothetical protein